jgi:hypothetical protein
MYNYINIHMYIQYIHIYIYKHTHKYRGEPVICVIRLLHQLVEKLVVVENLTSASSDVMKQITRVLNGIYMYVCLLICIYVYTYTYVQFIRMYEYRYRCIFLPSIGHMASAGATYAAKPQPTSISLPKEAAFIVEVIKKIFFSKIEARTLNTLLSTAIQTKLPEFLLEGIIWTPRIFIYLFLYVYIYTSVYIYVYIYKYIYKYVYICIYMYL